jgi:ribose 1,5-bisphosphokinase
MNADTGFAGRLFYLMGPSGSGKDSLIQYVRARVGDAPVRFARRYVTRPAGAGGEPHIAISPAGLARLREEGALALHWHANGLEYGIGIEIEDWLRAGLDVVVNGSRAYLDEAAGRYPELCPVLIDVAEEVLAERLIQRGRETPAEIHARIARARALPPPGHPALVLIRNDDNLTEAGDALLDLLVHRA